MGDYLSTCESKTSQMIFVRYSEPCPLISEPV